MPIDNTLSALKPFDFQAAVARAGMRLPEKAAAGSSRGLEPLAGMLGAAAGSHAGVQGVAPGGFRHAMVQAMQAVSQQQMQAAHLQRELTLENPSVSLEQTMVAMQKAQLGFSAAVQVRNRLLSAYTEVMNMQV